MERGVSLFPPNDAWYGPWGGRHCTGMGVMEQLLLSSVLNWAAMCSVM